MSLDHFHPTVARWFRDRFGEPSPPQIDGWPKIRTGRHTLIAAPTGTGKALEPAFPEVRVLVRSGDTPASERAAMVKRPPHILVTTPESLYILLSPAIRVARCCARCER